ncbi:hypothetical protein GCM10009838_57520 [Catenulispora subtropica]|uniref:Uncharacterized protein n=1 Tax=Catenulispora subtropica TaxID=450798 RepID=A0ABP5DVY3_9ACTN
MSEQLPFLLREQAWDRFNEYRDEHAPGSAEDPTAEEDRLAPGPGQVLQEYRRLRHAAEIAERTYQRAEADEVEEVEEVEETQDGGSARRRAGSAATGRRPRSSPAAAR